MSKNSQNVQSIERALDLLEQICTERSGLGITELSAQTELSKSTVHRLCGTLYDRGYLDKTEDSRYKVGLKLIEVVSYYINSLELQTEARPYLRAISSKLNLTAHLGVLDGDEVVYVEKMDMFSGIKLYSQIGFRVPAYCSSLGKCLLSRFSAEALEAALSNCNFEAFTEATTTSIAALKSELVGVRQRGWAIDNGEYDRELRCISAPIYDYRGEIIAAISASGSTDTLTNERIDAVAAYVKSIAEKLSQEMGFPVSTETIL